MNKKILLLILLVVLVLPGLASAADFIQNMVQGAVTTAFYIADGVVVILWVVTGILFLLAQGAPEKLNSAKKALFAAVAGTVLVLVANSAVYMVSHAFNIPIT
ncbi:MAG: hypothetical protein ABSF55_03045 [Candidatus Staskawiczbacteria bacterium]|jgi:uncharacterized membrane protein (DUF485 family)